MMNGAFVISIVLIVAAVVLTVMGYGQAAVTTAIVAGIGAAVSHWFKPKDGEKDNENRS